jgi:N-acetylmuramoyl-L-alanine amidase
MIMMNKKDYHFRIWGCLFALLLFVAAPAAQASLSGLKIGIDPGHGGSAPGAVGPTGLTEKEINLNTSLFLRDYIQADGATAYLTRTTDVDVSLSDRTDYFNSIPVDRAISVHHNASGTASANYTGVHVYLGMGWTTSGDLAYDVVHHFEDHMHIGFVWSNCTPSREGVYESDFHMVRETTMPSILTECSFISNWAEEYRLYDLNYNFQNAWAIYAGTCDHYSSTYPSSPSNLRVISSAGNSVVSWSAASGASGYRVYRSTDGQDFDSDTLVTGTTVTFTDITPGTAYYFQVAGVNGTSPRSEGYPTEVLAARAAAKSTNVLVVNGVDRQHEEGGNTRNFIIQHGGSLANLGYAFDSASNEAVAGGSVSLTNYEVVDWMLGEESTADETFSSTEQSRVQTFLNGGGNLFVSGAEIGWDLDHLGSSADKSFYNDYLKASYVADDAAVYSVSGLASTIFEGLSGITYDNGTSGPYHVEYPDGINSYGGSVINMAYDGTGYKAGVEYDGSFKVVNLGFPFEAIISASDRDTLMARVMNFLMPLDNVPPAAVSDLTATLSGNDIALSWSAVSIDTTGSTEVISHYVVYRSEDPDFEPGPGDSIAGTPENNYSDGGAAGDTLTNYFYVIRAVDSAGNKSASSSRVGEFDKFIYTNP